MNLSTHNTASTANGTSNANGVEASIIRFGLNHSDMEHKPATGNRIVELNYKAAVSGVNKGKKAKENSYIEIPDHITEESVTANLSALLPAIVYTLQQAEEQLLRKEHVAGSKGFTASWFTLDKIAAFMEASGQSKRLSKDDIHSWFDASMADSLLDILAGKLGISIEEPTESELLKLSTMLDVYKTKLAVVASPHATYTEDEAGKLLRLFELIPASLEQPTGKSVHARIAKLLKDAQDATEMMDDL